MICLDRPTGEFDRAGESDPSDELPASLSASDVPEMMALVAAAQPGPFFPETIRMGRYFGIRTPQGSLAAMAGQRLRLHAFEEISAVCTAAEQRGKGHAQRLVHLLARLAHDAGKVPFLHLRPDNPARRVYERVGFTQRRQLHGTVITPTVSR